MIVNIVDGKPEGYLTISEFANKFHFNEGSVRVWIQRGQIPKHRILTIRSGKSCMNFIEDTYQIGKVNMH